MTGTAEDEPRSPWVAGGDAATLGRAFPVESASLLPLVTADWLRSRLGDGRLHVLHASVDRTVYDAQRIPGARFVDVHAELAVHGHEPCTGDVEREWILPDRAWVQALLARWGVDEGDRVVCYDDVGLNRHAIRLYWLLRLYGYPPHLVHVLDGGIEAWRRAVDAGSPGDLRADPWPRDARPDQPPLDPRRSAGHRPAVIGERDPTLLASVEQVAAWSRQAARPGGPTRILDVRSAAEFVGTDLRARRGGHVPGARHRYFEDFVAEDGTLRPPSQVLSLLRGSGVEPTELRAAYCQGGVRAALAWFVLHELAGLQDVCNFAGSWEEWGNREDVPVEL